MPAQTSTYDLISRCQSGDQSAFALLWEKYRHRLEPVLYYKMSEAMRARVEMEDLLQEVFWEASRQAGNFTYRASGSFLAWLCRIADHVVKDEARYASRQKRDAALAESLPDGSHVPTANLANELTPSRILRGKQDLRRLLEKLDQLPADYRDVILLARFEERSTSEIAGLMGKSRESVAVLLHRALARLRETQ